LVSYPLFPFSAVTLRRPNRPKLAVEGGAKFTE
jgi:hypothetical protein